MKYKKTEIYNHLRTKMARILRELNNLKDIKKLYCL